MKFYCEDHQKVLDELHSTREGISSEEASKKARRKRQEQVSCG